MGVMRLCTVFVFPLFQSAAAERSTDMLMLSPSGTETPEVAAATAALTAARSRTVAKSTVDVQLAAGGQIAARASTQNIRNHATEVKQAHDGIGRQTFPEEAMVEVVSSQRAQMDTDGAGTGGGGEPELEYKIFMEGKGDEAKKRAEDLGTKSEKLQGVAKEAHDKTEDFKTKIEALANGAEGANKAPVEAQKGNRLHQESSQKLLDENLKGLHPGATGAGGDATGYRTGAGAPAQSQDSPAEPLAIEDTGYHGESDAEPDDALLETNHFQHGAGGANY